MREHRLSGGNYFFFVSVRLVVEYEGVVCVSEVLLSLLLYLRACLNPVKTFGAVARAFGVSCLIHLKNFIMSHFFFFFAQLC